MWRGFVNSAELVLFRLSAVWTAVGLASGLAYRELTRSTGFSGFTQLAVVHTHTLVLGTIAGLGLLALQRLYHLGEDRRFAWFVWIWNIGLALTAAGMALKGTLQVLGSTAAGSPAIAGISGLGHIVLTVGFVLVFLVLGRRIRQTQAGSDPATTGAQSA
jgi:hypothetical protein